MGFFSRRKDLKKAVATVENVQAHTAEVAPPSLLLSLSKSPLPEFEPSSSTLTRCTPTVANQRPCLKRATHSDNSICLAMHAANNRLAHKASQGTITAMSLDERSKPGSRSSSSTRAPKSVTFKLDNEENGQTRRPRDPPLPKSRLPISTTNDESSDTDDEQDAGSVSSTNSWASSNTSVDLDTIPISGAPRRPSHVASGFDRRMSKLPPVPSRDDRPRPKLTLGHSKSGQPSWSLKGHRQPVTAH